MNDRQFDLLKRATARMKGKTKGTLAVSLVKAEDRIAELEAQLAAVQKANGLPFPQDEGENSTPTWEYP